MKNKFKILAIFLLGISSAYSANDLPIETDTASVRLGVNVGFNYECLFDPTAVSFEKPDGRMVFNVPFVVPFSDNVGEILSQSLDGSFNLKPEVEAGQKLNLGLKVNVPMMGGVCTFSYNNNVDLDYMTVLGNANIKADTTMEDENTGANIGFVLKGAANIPIGLKLGWRVMSFGYAYEPVPNLVLAVGAYRHMFEFEGEANVAVDLLGNTSVSISTGSALGDISTEIPINYSSRDVYGYADADYSADAWSYSFGIKYWRFSLVSRFGLNTKAKGTFDAAYSLPFFYDPKTFKSKLEGDKLDSLIMTSEFQNDLILSRTDSIIYHSKNDAEWRLPTGHTFSFDLVKRKLFISYTKVVGDIELKHIYEGNDGDIKDTTDNRNDLDLGIKIDNIVLLGGRFSSANFTIGLFTMDVRVFDNENIIGNSLPSDLQILGAPTLPVLRLGSAIGSTIKLLVHADILPLPSFKTGLIYNF